MLFLTILLAISKIAKTIDIQITKDPKTQPLGTSKLNFKFQFKEEKSFSIKDAEFLVCFISNLKKRSKELKSTLNSQKNRKMGTSSKQRMRNQHG